MIESDMRHLFKPHGKFLLYRDDNILVTDITGPWNIELIKFWAKAAIPYSLEMQTIGVWGAVAIISESMLCSPDAMQALRKNVAYSVHGLGCVSHCIVAEADVLGRGIVEPAFERAYEGLCPSNFFYDYESAKLWTQSQIQVALDKQVNKM